MGVWGRRKLLSNKYTRYQCFLSNTPCTSGCGELSSLLSLLLLCKSVRISEPHFIPTHVSTTGSNATRTPEDASCQHPPVLLRLDCSQLIGPRPKPTVRRLDLSSKSPRLTGHPPRRAAAYYFNGAFGDPRSGTGVRSGGARGSAAAPFAHPSRTPRIHDTARRIRDRLPPWLIARRYQWRGSTTKPARKAISTPAGVRARGAPLWVGNRYGVRDGVSLLTMLP